MVKKAITKDAVKAKPVAKAVTKTIKKESKKSSEKSSSAGRTQRQLARRFHKLAVGKTKGRGVVYVGHLPKGFNENELK